MIIKIYSERNTGSHYLMQLLRDHLDVLEKKGSAIRIASAGAMVDLQCLGELGWKHCLARAEFLQEEGISREAILIATLTKNPYSWLLSLHKRPYAPIHLRSGVLRREANGKARRQSFFDKLFIKLVSRLGRCGRLWLSRYARWCIYEKLEFKDFIRAKWFTEFHERHDEGFKNAIELWNEKNRAYLELAKEYDVILCTYEELLANPESVVRKITDKLNLPLDKFKNIDVAAKAEDSHKNHAYYQDYYLQERWREKLSEQDIKWINANLDEKVMKAFGYQYL